MTRWGQAALTTFAYGIAALIVLGMGFAATMALTGGSPSDKIGPGYGRMQPIDLGKPDKVISIPPYSIPIRGQTSAVKRAPPKTIEELIAESAPPLKRAVVPCRSS